MLKIYRKASQKDIERLQKQGVRAEEHYHPNIVTDEKNPLKGVITKQRANAQKASDVLNTDPILFKLRMLSKITTMGVFFTFLNASTLSLFSSLFFSFRIFLSLRINILVLRSKQLQNNQYNSNSIGKSS